MPDTSHIPIDLRRPGIAEEPQLHLLVDNVPVGRFRTLDDAKHCAFGRARAAAHDMVITVESPEHVLDFAIVVIKK